MSRILTPVLAAGILATLLAACGDEEALPGGERASDPQPVVGLGDLPVFAAARKVHVGPVEAAPTLRVRLIDTIEVGEIWDVVDREGAADLVLGDDGDRHLELRTADTGRMLWRSSLVLDDERATVDAVLAEFREAIDRD